MKIYITKQNCDRAQILSCFTQVDVDAGPKRVHLGCFYPDYDYHWTVARIDGYVGHGEVNRQIVSLQGRYGSLAQVQEPVQAAAQYIVWL